MVNTEVYIVQEGQSLYDVCAHLYGSADALPKLFQYNTNLQLDSLFVGQAIYYVREIVNANVRKVYDESRYIPATSSQMLPAPPPPPAPPADGVVISQFGLPDITIVAPGEYEVAPSRVEDGSGNIIATLSPGEVYIDAPQSVTINMHGIASVTIVAPGSFTVPPSTVKKNGDLIATLGPGQEYIIPIESVNIVFPNDTEIEVAAPGTYIVEPSKVVDSLGNTLAELSPGEEYEVSLTGSGILYKRPIITQRTSFRLGDTGWAYQNGFYDFSSDPNNPEFIQDLDYADTANFFWKLKHNNAFGNKNRFTNSIGFNPNASGTPVGMTYSGAIADYIIDHLTGFGYKKITLGSAPTWTGTIDQITSRRNTALDGFDDWIPLSYVEMAMLTGHLYNHTLINVGDWTGETVDGTPDAWRWVTNSIRATAKSTPSGITLTMSRKHY